MRSDDIFDGARWYYAYWSLLFSTDGVYVFGSCDVYVSIIKINMETYLHTVLVSNGLV